MLQSYDQDVLRIFLGGPDTIPVLLQSYDKAALGLFSQPPPDNDKPAQQQQIQDFRQLTHNFENDVMDAIQLPPDQD